MWYVYIVNCSKDNSFYTGITTDLTRRIKEHNESKKGARYTKTRRPVKLLTSFEVLDQSSALKLEYKIKQLSRQEKIFMIMKSRAIEMLNETRKRASMYCASKEALLSRVSTILEFAGVTYDYNSFYRLFSNATGNILTDLVDHYDSEWSNKVIDHALELLK